MAGAAVGCEAAEDFTRLKWLKLAINCVANPLAGLMGLGNSQIIDPALDPAKEAILAEVRAVAAAEGMSLDTTAADINRYLNNQNIPSLRVDIERGSETEIDFLNGAVAAREARHGIPTPVNEAVVSMIRFLSGKGLPSGGPRE